MIYQSIEMRGKRYIHGAFIKFFEGHLVEGEGRDGSVLVGLLVGDERYQNCNVFFQLSQELSDIVFIEQGFFVIVHSLGYTQEELALPERLNHVLDKGFDLAHLSLHFFDLHILLVHLLLVVVDLLLQARPHVFLLLLRHLPQLLMLVNFAFNHLVLLFNHVDLAVEHVDVVVEGVVLLLRLDEGCHDFLRGGDPRRLLDLLKRVLDDLHVPYVHVHQALLLLIVVCPLLKPKFEKGHWVGELCLLHLDLLVSSAFLYLGSLEFRLIFVFEFVLQLLQVLLKLVLFHLMLSFQGENLIFGFLCDSGTLVGTHIHFLRIIASFDDFFVQVFVHPCLNLHLLPLHVQLRPQSLVSKAQLIVLY